MKKYVLVLFVVLFMGYVARLFYVESSREYSVGGFVQILSDVIGKEKQSNLWADGIGCAYWLRLKKCIGIEILGPIHDNDIVNKITTATDNFCGLVESNYPREKYLLQRGALAKEFDPGLGRAYQTFFDCKNSKKAIGEIRVYVNPSGIPTYNAESIVNPKLTKIFQN